MVCHRQLKLVSIALLGGGVVASLFISVLNWPNALLRLFKITWRLVLRKELRGRSSTDVDKI